MAQEQNELTKKWYPGVELEWGITEEIQVNVNNYYLTSTRFAHGWTGGFGWNFLGDKKGGMFMAGYDVIGISNVMFYGISSVNLKYYPWLDHKLTLAPEVGVGCFIFQFSYQPNIPLVDEWPAKFPIHQFKLSLNFNVIPSVGPFMRLGAGMFEKKWNHY